MIRDLLDHGRSKWTNESLSRVDSSVHYFDLTWPEWSRITDSDPDHPKGMHPNIIMLHLGHRVGTVVIASHHSGRPMFKSRNQCYCLNLLLVLFFASICFSFLQNHIQISIWCAECLQLFWATGLSVPGTVLFKSTFLWDDLDQDQWSEISWIMVDQNEPMNPCPEWIHQFIILI